MTAAAPPEVHDTLGRPASTAGPSWTDRHRRLIAVGLFPIIITSLLLVVHEGMKLSNAVRAYIAGESLWSKGQKDAVQHLYRFATTHDDAEYRRYQSALAVPLADRKARLILQGAQPDVDAAAQWFVVARNDPADARNMAELFLHFGWVSYMRRAIDIWTVGDQDIDRVQQLAEQLHGLVRAGVHERDQYHAVVDSLAAVNDHLTVLEANFSATLGAGARWMSGVLFAVAVVTGLMLMWIGTAVTGRLLHHARAAAESERALRRSEAQLRQAQKMEAIGRLAGGVAHDFNNLLTVIGASIDMALQEMLPPTRFASNLLLDARRAAERAEALTQQLLSFSRQQIVRPRVLRLDAAVADIERMLARLIGEDIQLLTTLDPATPAILADPGQIGQVILNLAVNAREAMPHGGTLTIRTRYVGEGERGPADVVASPPAGWGVLEVSDTGVGMTDTIRAQIFEPFFTTRGDGEGVGLGLSVVYGIVTQSSGHIEVDSGVGAGSTFRIFFPACEADEPPPAREVSALPQKGSETILIVEDEKVLRSLISEVLRQKGYAVLAVANGEDALALMEQEGDSREVDLLITDVVMPSMGGRELVQELSRRGFEIPVLYMSGYTKDPAPLENMAGEKAPFLPKPFTIDQLGHMVRRTINTSVRAPGLPIT